MSNTRREASLYKAPPLSFTQHLTLSEPRSFLSFSQLPPDFCFISTGSWFNVSTLYLLHLENVICHIATPPMVRLKFSDIQWEYPSQDYSPRSRVEQEKKLWIVIILRHYLLIATIISSWYSSFILSLLKLYFVPFLYYTLLVDMVFKK